MPKYVALNTGPRMFGGVDEADVSAYRTLYFSEKRDGSAFFMNVIGQSYKLNTVFNNNNPPAIVTTQGAVERWTIQTELPGAPRVSPAPDTLQGSRAEQL